MRTGTVVFGMICALSVGSGACSKDSAAPKGAGEPVEKSVPEASRPSPPSAARLVGVVHEDGEHVCFGDGQETWINKFRQIGFVRVVAGDAIEAQLVEAMGTPVVAHGRITDRVPAGGEQPPGERGECPQYQMRSDWVLTSSGMRIRRGESPAMKAFEVDRVEPLTGLSARIEGEQLKVSFTNELGVALDAPVELVVHYEGCYGKPGSDSRTLVANEKLLPGATLAGTVPLITEADRVPGNPKGTRDHRAYSVELRASADGVYFDLDVSVRQLGADVQCPQQ